MKGFFSAMGADSRWEGSSGNQGNRIGDVDEEEMIKRTKVDVNCNLALVYCKMENGEKALKYANDALALDPSCSKAVFRKCQVRLSV
jgi:hypothetical protein